MKTPAIQQEFAHTVSHIVASILLQNISISI